eukprot:CAMPEP_0202049268 /NCGR_PEP_ID=MMETSP0963-20130614/3269_1 /ASSEMBLY_ACC=CAM_ASM_000494 /TAXON_ID=4773 /ORGANISM="Schizochytrium aggregatum, Strain ATCC28209" /LENGTH=182 /DNA_ID=CAMNT_0048614265 /DNA_START=781 /DNA_END=1327 /DNA_ORIENTATION=-
MALESRAIALDAAGLRTAPRRQPVTRNEMYQADNIEDRKGGHVEERGKGWGEKRKGLCRIVQGREGLRTMYASGAPLTALGSLLEEHLKHLEDDRAHHDEEEHEEGKLADGRLGLNLLLQLGGQRGHAGLGSLVADPPLGVTRDACGHGACLVACFLARPQPWTHEYTRDGNDDDDDDDDDN